MKKITTDKISFNLSIFSKSFLWKYYSSLTKPEYHCPALIAKSVTYSFLYSRALLTAFLITRNCRPLRNSFGEMKPRHFCNSQKNYFALGKLYFDKNQGKKKKSSPGSLIFVLQESDVMSTKNSFSEKKDITLKQGNISFYPVSSEKKENRVAMHLLTSSNFRHTFLLSIRR